MKKGQILKELMQQKGVSVEAFAAEFDLSTSSVFKYYNKDSFDSTLLEKFASYFKIPITYFFNDNSLSSFDATLIKAGKPTLITELESVGRTAPTADPSIANEARLWAMLESQQRMIESQQRMLESQQRTIEEFAKKRIAEAAPGVAPKAARG